MSEMPGPSDIAKKEEETLAFWSDRSIFDKTLAKPAPKGEFVFYEGPPTANGRPGIHHLETRAFKDAILRYKTMRGYRVPRRAGWDTHGLPVELEVEKELGFSGKKDIEVYGIAAFNAKCKESVLRYVDEWTRFTGRIGYWVDQARAYFTFSPSYMEVVWHIFAKIAKDGRLYKDYKVVPWCPRCGTGLSSHELAQGYADVKDIAVTVKFELLATPGTYLLAWTTTPWTLPGNVALAIGASIDYGLYEREGEKVIVADARAPEVLGEGWQRLEAVDTDTLIGAQYRPLYAFAKELAEGRESSAFETAFRVYAAPFVTTEDGTGIVHTAVMYGQEDFELGKKERLPKVHLVNSDGVFIPGTGFLAGRSVVEEATSVEILKNLAGQKLLFSKEAYAHSYPFCWRCKTRIIYYARDSWYIRMTDLRDALVEENHAVHWEPAYIRDGRMGEWLSGVKDWAISRERYWGTPLPIWTDERGTERLVVGSVAELLARTKKSGNRYFIMRHGEAELKKDEVNSDSTIPIGLTEAGKKETRVAAAKLRSAGITRIIASPFPRTKETADIVASELSIPAESIHVDVRLGELQFGELEGKTFDDFVRYRDTHVRDFTTALPRGESYLDVQKRFGEALYALEEQYAGEAILIVTHSVGISALRAVAKGVGESEATGLAFAPRVPSAFVEELPFTPLPHNERFELDLHRPFVDTIVLLSDSGKELRRVPEVMDVWFDSGAMPFAQGSAEKGELPLSAYVKRVSYPADYIVEGIDQTRGWFYTLLAVGTLLGRGKAYRNVLSLGHLLDAQGQKMSKSKGNVIEPFIEMDRIGADAVRFWMYYVNQSGDSKQYDERTVKEAVRVLSWFENCAAFYTLFGGSTASAKAGASTHVLDRWMRARLEKATKTVTDALDAYRLYDAAREMAAFAEDLSQWYVRRSRDRMRAGDAEAIDTLRETLRISARLIAPFAPFLAERLFREVRSKEDPESVHLTDWPEVRPTGILARFLRGRDGSKLIKDMARVRALASDGLQLRQKAGIKVRQPLHRLSIPDPLTPELIAILAEEVNVKSVRTLASAVELETTLTPELIEEGDTREFARAVADARKSLNLSPKADARVVLRAEGKFSAELSTGGKRFDLEVAQTE